MVTNKRKPLSWNADGCSQNFNGEKWRIRLEKWAGTKGSWRTEQGPWPRHSQEQLGEPSTDTELALICPQSESNQVCSTGSPVKGSVINLLSVCAVSVNLLNVSALRSSITINNRQDMETM